MQDYEDLITGATFALFTYLSVIMVLLFILKFLAAVRGVV